MTLPIIFISLTKYSLCSKLVDSDLCRFTYIYMRFSVFIQLNLEKYVNQYMVMSLCSLLLCLSVIEKLSLGYVYWQRTHMSTHDCYYLSRATNVRDWYAHTGCAMESRERDYLVSPRCTRVQKVPAAGANRGTPLLCTYRSRIPLLARFQYIWLVGRR